MHIKNNCCIFAKSNIEIYGIPPISKSGLEVGLVFINNKEVFPNIDKKCSYISQVAQLIYLRKSTGKWALGV